jgi:hypothetical protein
MGVRSEKGELRRNAAGEGRDFKNQLMFKCSF